MCGIAGLIHKGRQAKIGEQMTQMLTALKHRGPDSTGLALYGAGGDGDYVMRIKFAEQEETLHGFRIAKQIAERKKTVEERLKELGAKNIQPEKAREYAYRYRFAFEGDLRRLANFIEDVEGARDPLAGESLGARQGPRRRSTDRHRLRPRKLRRLARDRTYAHGDRIGRRHTLRPSLLGLPLRRHLGCPQRAAHELLELAARDGTARTSLRLQLRQRAHRRLYCGSPL